MVDGSVYRVPGGELLVTAYGPGDNVYRDTFRLEVRHHPDLKLLRLTVGSPPSGPPEPEGPRRGPKNKFSTPLTTGSQ
jgi:hypothetical protein